MLPNFLKKFWCIAQAVLRVHATAKAANISFFSLFLADADSVFGNRQDQDKYETFLLLSNVPALAPYLAKTIPVSSSAFACNGDGSSRIEFPLVIKPVWGAQSAGVAGIRDEGTLQRFVQKWGDRYIAQQFIAGALEIGVSFTRNPAGPPDFFGVAAKLPVTGTGEWNRGLRKVPKSFLHRDITHDVDRERFLDLSRTIASTLRTNTLRFDAFVREGGGHLVFDTLQIIDVNTGVFATDEFLFDVDYKPTFIVDELTRRYTHLLVWGGRHPTPRQLRELLLHYLSCCSIVLYYRHFMDVLAKVPRY